MRILVTNDDGIRAPGVQALAQKMSKLGEVALIAPLEEKSAIGHGITIRDPICVHKINIEGVSQAWGVKGTPADCVKLGLTELFTEKCDLVISGINNGPNLGTDVLYSGTVSAAIEGVILGVPSLAISLAAWNYEDYSVAADIIYTLIKYMIKNKFKLPVGTLLNVNVPAVNKKDIVGYKVTILGAREYENRFEKRFDPRGNPYYWAVGEILPFKERDLDFDVVAVEKNYVSITPIQFDLTNYKIMQEIKQWGLEDL
ncbi:MAG TPA: 5'/3'-nucleotidase SurE [Clostridia bacterium]|jgi:5'-nucleotidase|nr:5'/3'-nucleotidase SurE [Clostridia bacterium]HHY06895.1 5'/3'-nucleotidase SurE [Clostridia bacterium]